MIGHIDQAKPIEITSPLAKNSMMKALVGEHEGWDSHVFRVVEVKANGYTPKHQHAWPHINYVLEGQGIIMIDGIETLVKPGHYAFIPGNTIHQFKNNSDQVFKFICIVPKEGHVY